jgi:Family of unknown function (DUF6252)
MKKAISIFLVMSIFACQEKLPKPTETGTNTFGCKINGKSWIPDGGKGFMAQKPISGGFQNIANSGVLTIFINTINKNGEVIQLYVDSQATGNYLLNKTTGFIPNEIFPKNYGLCRFGGKIYITNIEDTGKVVITKVDKSTGVISGIFEFTAGSGTEKIKITEGRFDINSKTI